jgi:hypothetical protein
MATITITYTAPVSFTKDADTQQIFSVWNPAATASDNAVFEGTYYDTNKWDNGEFPYATTLQQFLDSQVAHPGLIAALRAAVRAGSYAWEASDADALYVEELAPALKDQGFEFDNGSGSSGEG